MTLGETAGRQLLLAPLTCPVGLLLEAILAHRPCHGAVVVVLLEIVAAAFVTLHFTMAWHVQPTTNAYWRTARAVNTFALAKDVIASRTLPSTLCLIA